MGTNLVLYENNQQIEISTEDIRKYIASDLNEKEFFMFIQTAKTYGLNPFKREIYAVKYGNTFSVITGYHVYLQKVDNAQILEYWDCIVEKPDPKNIDTWIGVFTAKRTDWTMEFTWKVPMKEVNKKQALWNLQPEFQLRKVAISQGLRMLCPAIVGGMPYIVDELGIEEESRQQSPAANVEKPTEPAAEPNGGEKQIRLKKVMAEIDHFTDIASLDAWVLKNVKKITASDLKGPINAYVVIRTQEITDIVMAKNMGVDIQDLMGFRKAINSDGIDKSLVEQILADNKEACRELQIRILNWKKERDAKIDAEAGTQSEETEPDALEAGPERQAEPDEFTTF